MEVILLERVERLGGIGDVVNVKDGYARNYLIPQSKALRANETSKAAFAAQKAEIEAKNQELKAEAEVRAKKVDGLYVTVIRQASEDGRLFGSVTSRDIAKGVAETDAGVSHQNVRLNDTVKSIGVYPVRVQLHPEVICTVRVNVARSETEAQQAKKSGILGPIGGNKGNRPAVVIEEVVEEAPVLAEAAEAVDAPEGEAAA